MKPLRLSGPVRIPEIFRGCTLNLPSSTSVPMRISAGNNLLVSRIRAAACTSGTFILPLFLWRLEGFLYLLMLTGFRNDTGKARSGRRRSESPRPGNLASHRSSQARLPRQKSGRRQQPLELHRGSTVSLLRWCCIRHPRQALADANTPQLCCTYLNSGLVHAGTGTHKRRPSKSPGLSPPGAGIKYGTGDGGRDFPSASNDSPHISAMQNAEVKLLNAWFQAAQKHDTLADKCQPASGQKQVKPL